MFNQSGTPKERKSLRRAGLALLGLAVLVPAASGCQQLASLTKTVSNTTSSNTSSSETTNKTGPLKTDKRDAPGADVGDLARYPGSVRQSDTVVVGAAGKRSGTLIYQTADQVSEVLDFYEEEATRQDWTIDVTLDTKDGKIMQLIKGKRKASLNIARREGIDFTDIVIQYREY